MKTNPYFANIDRPAYELGHLLKKMPGDFSRSHPLTPDDRLIAVESQFLQETEWSIRETLEVHGEREAVQATKSKVGK